MRSQNHMEHKTQDAYYGRIFKLINDNELNFKQTYPMTLSQSKIPQYVKPIYAIGTTVTYKVGNGYKMGRIIKAFTFKGKWRYVFEGRKDKIAETDIKEIVILNNQALIEGL